MSAAVFAAPGIAQAAIAQPGQADCTTIETGKSSASSKCQNLTDHEVTAELWVNCKPASPDQHTSAVVAPGSTVTLSIDCPTPWDRAVGGAASVH